MLGVYGAAFLQRALTPEEEFGLWLNLPRLRLERAAQTAAGIIAGMGNSQLGREWFDAVALDESEIDPLAWKVNADRASALAAQTGRPF